MTNRFLIPFLFPAVFLCGCAAEPEIIEMPESARLRREECGGKKMKLCFFPTSATLMIDGPIGGSSTSFFSYIVASAALYESFEGIEIKEVDWRKSYFRLYARVLKHLHGWDLNSTTNEYTLPRRGDGGK